jgi:threonine/homoserine/homoserine lactone efflux protein
VTEPAAFLAVATVVIVTPGPDTALTIRNTLLGGRRGGVLTAVGVSTGQATWTIATATGIAALLAASEPAFRALKLAGAAYLVFLGAQAVLAAIFGEEEHRAAPPSRQAPFRQGLISNLGNPKMAVFFPALLPQFAASFPWLVLLGIVFCLMTLFWLVAYAFAVARAGDFLRRSKVRRALEAATGAVLVALGLRVATSAR